jgi:hypothetical protein
VSELTHYDPGPVTPCAVVLRHSPRHSHRLLDSRRSACSASTPIAETCGLSGSMRRASGLGFYEQRVGRRGVAGRMVGVATPPIPQATIRLRASSASTLRPGPRRRGAGGGDTDTVAAIAGDFPALHQGLSRPSG